MSGRAILDRIDATTTKCTLLYINSHFFTKDGYVSMEEEAACWGFPSPLDGLSEVDQERQFKAHANGVGDQFLKYYRSVFTSNHRRVLDTAP